MPRLIQPTVTEKTRATWVAAIMNRLCPWYTFESIRAWFRTPHDTLGGATPEDLLEDPQPGDPLLDELWLRVVELSNFAASLTERDQRLT